MAEQWSPQPPVFPSDFCENDLETLRALSRYACGIRHQAYVFPETAPERYKNHEELNRRIQVVKRLCGITVLLTRDNIEAFCTKGFKFGFPGEAARNKLRRIYSYVYLFLRENVDDHQPMFNLVASLYSRHGPELGDVTFRLSEYFKVDERALREASRVISGAFYLYRYGSVSGRTAELIRSVVRIALVQGRFGKRLRFSIFYESGDAQKTGPICDIEGFVIPRGERYFLLAIDYGTGDSPCLLVLDRKKGRDNFLAGLMLRVSTLNKVAATRVYLEPLMNQVREDQTEEIDRIFEQHRSDAKILTLDQAIETQIEPFERLINNGVDMINSFMLTAPEV